MTAGQKVGTKRQVQITEDGVAHTGSYQHDHRFPGPAHKEALTHTMSDWSREANQSLDPNAKNPRRSKPEREAAAGWMH